MSSSDLFTADYPHGTAEGYDGPDGHDGCRGGSCPGGDLWGLTCKDAKRMSRGDYRYQKLVKQGLTPAQIADELGLIPTGAPAKPVTKHAPKRKPKPAAAEILDEPADAQHNSPPAAIIDDVAHDENEPTTTITAAAPDDDHVTTKPTPTPKEIRAWATSRGYEVKPMGKLPQHVIDHYWETHDVGATPPEVDTPEVDTPAPEEDTDTPETVTIVPEPAGDRPEWGYVTLTEDLARAQTDRDALAEDLEETQGELTRARGLAARLEEELARDREIHAAEISDLHTQLNDSHNGDRQRIEQLEESLALAEQDERIRAWELVAGHRAFAACYGDDAPLLTSILKRLNELSSQDAAETIARLTRTLEFTIRQWAIERDRTQHHDDTAAPTTLGLAERIRRGWATTR